MLTILIIIGVTFKMLAILIIILLILALGGFGHTRYRRGWYRAHGGPAGGWGGGFMGIVLLLIVLLLCLGVIQALRPDGESG
jgi:uncharacterized membrane protein